VDEVRRGPGVGPLDAADRRRQRELLPIGARIDLALRVLAARAPDDPEVDAHVAAISARLEDLERLADTRRPS
jgi:hypothetical protein